jgi:RNA polymerase sigma factor (sigma-70 family)
MVNLQLSNWRRRRVRSLLAAAPPECPGPDETAGIDRRDELLRACRTLPPRMRAVLVLRYFEDLPEAEVARLLGIGIGSVKSQTSRALGRLRVVLETGRDGAAPAVTPVARPASTSDGSLR